MCAGAGGEDALSQPRWAVLGERAALALCPFPVEVPGGSTGSTAGVAPGSLGATSVFRARQQ